MARMTRLKMWKMVKRMQSPSLKLRIAQLLGFAKISYQLELLATRDPAMKTMHRQQASMMVA